jgi:four helix bundle protein
MAKVERFEDLIAWQKARALTRAIYEVTRNGDFTKDYGLSRQIQRADVSVMSNIAEGFERGARGEFHQFLSTAKASCAELRSQLYVALDAGYLDEASFDALSYSKLRKWPGLWAACAPLCTDRKQTEANERHYSSPLQLIPSCVQDKVIWEGIKPSPTAFLGIDR